MEVSHFRTKLERKKGQRDQLLKSIQSTEKDINHTKKRMTNIEQAQTIIQTIAKKTQSELEYRISEPISMALDYVFKKPYQFKINFEPRRGKTEADILFTRNGKELDPMFASGFGPVNIAAFALRISLQALQKPTTRNILISDEPFRDLKGDDMPEKAGEMAKILSEKLNLQLIINSHTQEIINSADKVFKTSLKNGITQMEIIKE